MSLAVGIVLETAPTLGEVQLVQAEYLAPPSFYLTMNAERLRASHGMLIRQFAGRFTWLAAEALEIARLEVSDILRLAPHLRDPKTPLRKSARNTNAA